MPFAAAADLTGAATRPPHSRSMPMAARCSRSRWREIRRSRGTRIYVEVFRVVDVLGQALHERLTACGRAQSSLRTRLPSDGTYHVLVQTDGRGAGHYRLTLELGAALPFPVVGAREDSIRSLFGASRDAGRRAMRASISLFSG